MKKEILLSVTMLVSDREDTIEKCLSSLSHLRETVPSELIVVDTAGNETCMEIVRKYTDQIVRFEWCDDFSAARNAGLVKATGKWVMYLDDDEWFENTEEIEQFFLSGEYRKYHSASYLQRNYHDRPGNSWSDVDVMRMAERTQQTRFIRKIHEQLYPCFTPVKYFSDYVHHYGYVYKTKEERNRHSWRNIKPLQEMYQEDPKNYHTLSQLVNEYIGIGEYFNALKLCQDIWRRKDCWENPSNARYANYLIMTEMLIYIRQDRFADGYAAGKEILADKRLSVLARGVVTNQMADICYRLGKYEESLTYSERLFDVAREWEAVPDKKTPDGFSACSPYLSQKELTRHRFLQIHLHVLQENWAKAEQLLSEIDWQSPDFCLIQESSEDIINIFARKPFDEALFSVLEAMFEKKDVRPLIYQAFDAAKDEEKDALMEYFSQLSPDDEKLCCLHIIQAGKQGGVAMAVPALEKMREKNYPFFLEDKAYWKSLQKLKIDLNSYLAEMDSYTWMNLAQRLCSLLKYEDWENAYLCLARGLEKTDLRYLYLSGLMMEKKLFQTENALRKKDKEESDLEGASSQKEEPEQAQTKEAHSEEAHSEEAQSEETPSEETDAAHTPQEIWDSLFQMCRYWVSCAAMLYREDVFLGELIQAIPPRYRFGWYIMQAGAVKETDHSLFLRKVADAAKAYPALKESCKRVITGVGREK